MRKVAWVVSRPGCVPDRVRDDYGAMVEDVEGVWAQLFPRQLGYRTQTQAVTEGEVLLTVRRGEFRGEVVLACEDRGGRLRIRAVSGAHSQRERTVAEMGERTVERARRLATTLGGFTAVWIMFKCFSWVAGGVEMPVVGGLILTVLTACLLIGGSSLGARVGEAIARRRQSLVERELSGDLGIQADIKRWNSLNRQLRGHRRALVRGEGGSPFRSPARA